MTFPIGDCGLVKRVVVSRREATYGLVVVEPEVATLPDYFLATP